jgi:hypothetical protein
VEGQICAALCLALRGAAKWRDVERRSNLRRGARLPRCAPPAVRRVCTGLWVTAANSRRVIVVGSDLYKELLKGSAIGRGVGCRPLRCSAMLAPLESG